MNNIAVIGTGYVGLVTGLGFAKLGNTVHFIDIDTEKIEKLKKQELPFFEPGLKELLEDEEVLKKVSYSSSYSHELKNADVIFVCVQTPEEEGVGSNTSYLQDALVSAIEFSEGLPAICIKSTAPPNFINDLEGSTFDNSNILFNPEFLREGSAIDDFFNPDRIVIGGTDKKRLAVLTKLYEDFNSEVIITDPVTALLIKYLSNTYLPMRLSFVNEAFQLGDSFNADIPNLLKGISADKRIGKEYFRPSPGWGGSCFPKDTKAIEAMFNDQNLNATLVNSINSSNKNHILWIADKVIELRNENSKKRIVLYGSAFKENTDDLRESPTIELYNILKSRNQEVYIFDEFGHELDDSISDIKLISDALVILMYPVTDISFVTESLNTNNKIYIPWENKVL